MFYEPTHKSENNLPYINPPQWYDQINNMSDHMYPKQNIYAYIKCIRNLRPHNPLPAPKILTNTQLIK